MKSTLQFCLIAVVATALAGCATTNTATTEKKASRDDTALAEAPLGSRIRKKSAINPVAGVNRDDVDTGKVQQNAAHSAAYQK